MMSLILLALMSSAGSSCRVERDRHVGIGAEQEEEDRDGPDDDPETQALEDGHVHLVASKMQDTCHRQSPGPPFWGSNRNDRAGTPVFLTSDNLLAVSPEHPPDDLQVFHGPIMVERSSTNLPRREGMSARAPSGWRHSIARRLNVSRSAT